ncbi:MAG TPA: PadR family transcriptional regulator [Bryobacteraceae bacterium]|jgi:DNA-binding PadR family transcriptional regulator|nr:PadR family transcriptional regulator [Bryobacteraceae bacterium]
MKNTRPPDSLLPLPTAMFHILTALAEEELHGYAIMQDVAGRTKGKVKMSPGTLYGAMRRMLELGLIVETAERPDPESDNERRRYYRMTTFGRQVAIAESARLLALVNQAKQIGWVG